MLTSIRGQFVLSRVRLVQVKQDGSSRVSLDCVAHVAAGFISFPVWFTHGMAPQKPGAIAVLEYSGTASAGKGPYVPLSRCPLVRFSLVVRGGFQLRVGPLALRGATCVKAAYHGIPGLVVWVLLRASPFWGIDALR